MRTLWWSAFCFLFQLVFAPGFPAQSTGNNSVRFTQVTLASVSTTSVAIHWNTNVLTIGRVEYGRNSAGEASVSEPFSKNFHRTVLSGLSPATSYVYRVVANDDFTGNSATTSLLQFKTGSSPAQPASPSANAIFVAQVVESQELRTNLGVNNLSTSIANVNTTLVDNDGMILARKSFTVQPRGLHQVNSVGRFLYDDHLGNEIYGQLYIESDHPVSAWASQINNLSNDPSILFSKTSGGTKLLVPSAANTATFRSSVAVMNVGSSDAIVQMAAYDTNGGLVSVVLMPVVVRGNVIAFDNVLENLGISQGFGPIEITSLIGATLIGVSRVSSLSNTSGFFEAVRDTAATTHQIVPHVIDTAELRTNIGINNPSNNQASVTIKLFNAEGIELGSLPTSVPPHGMTQINHVIRQVLGRTEMTGLQGYITVEATQPVIAWASQIDNVTDDPGLAISQAGGNSHVLIQSAANAGNFKSSLVIVNTGTSTAIVNLTSRDSNGNLTGQLQNLSIPAHGFFSVPNILERLGVSENFGPVEILSTNGQPLVVTSRVYSTSGTSGFFAGQPLE